MARKSNSVIWKSFPVYDFIQFKQKLSNSFFPTALSNYTYPAMPMSVTDVGNGLWWWHLWYVGDRFFSIVKVINIMILGDPVLSIFFVRYRFIHNQFFRLKRVDKMVKYAKKHRVDKMVVIFNAYFTVLSTMRLFRGDNVLVLILTQFFEIFNDNIQLPLQFRTHSFLSSFKVRKNSPMFSCMF